MYVQVVDVDDWLHSTDRAKISRLLAARIEAERLDTKQMEWKNEVMVHIKRVFFLVVDKHLEIVFIKH